jgi:ABC-type Fe3+/spermidine/putrescine transport system ATPase subunit
MSGIVEVSHLTKRFGPVTAVDDVSFEIGKSEFFTLLGSSGCGKTTTLRCVAGLETADEGEIRIAGEMMFARRTGANVPTHRRAIGMVFQSYAVWPHMSVYENIGYPLKVRGAGRTMIAERIAEVLRILDMEGLGDRMPSQLSGGQQQRVALGRALAVEPRVLLLDEPLSNLDAKLREQMRAELKQIQRETALPILYVTHDQIEALAMSDRIAVMSLGRIHQVAPPTEIYNSPASRFVLDFIGAVNYLPCTPMGEANGRLTLDIAGCGSLDIPRPPRVPNGPAFELAVRPEDIIIGPADAEGIAAHVEVRSFVGEAFEYYLRVGDFLMRARTDKLTEFPEQAEVRVGVRGGLVLDATNRSPEQSVV